MQLLLTLFFLYCSGLLAASVAKRRGRSESIWFFLGIVLGLLGVLLVVVLPPLPPKQLPTLPPHCVARSDSWLKLWYYLDAKRVPHGPLEFPSLIQLRKEATLSDHSFVWGEGMKEWKPLRELPELLQEMDG